MIHIGTSGYSYDDWIGPFYKEGIDKTHMLEEYSNVFGFTEINSTYYSLPNKFMFLNLVKKTPESFKFTVKLHSSMTHTRDADKNTYREFNDALRMLTENKKLGCVVAQFPHSFYNNSENIDYIKKLRDCLESVPMSVEFRNSRWLDIEIYKILSRENIGFICVDEPVIKGLVRQVGIVTSDVGYLRFHGRNTEKWYDHKESYERYNYLYDENELKEWIPKIKFIKEHSKVMFIAFNNHFKAQGAVNASMLQRLLK